MKKCADCPAIVEEHKWAMIRASSEGWLFLKDGTAYCPDHLPEWVAEWRARTNE